MALLVLLLGGFLLIAVAGGMLAVFLLNRSKDR